MKTKLNLPDPSASAGIIYAGSPFTTLLQASGQNLFLGIAAGNLTMSGYWNTGIGFEALYSNTSGNNNTASGLDALYSNTSGNDNTANGSGALGNNTTGSANAACGYQALGINTNGAWKTAVGYWALFGRVNGVNNTALGYQALRYLTTGSGNIGIGVNAGSAIFTGGNNIDIGNSGFGDESGVIRIGTVGTHTKAVFNGIFGTTVGGGVAVQVNANGLLGTVTSSRRFKQNIESMAGASDVLFALHPVTFQYKPDLDPEATPQFGLIAEDVEKVDPALVLHDDKRQICTVRYEAVNAMLLNEFLKEHRKVEDQNAKLQELSRAVDAQDSGNVQLKQRLEALEALIHHPK